MRGRVGSLLVREAMRQASRYGGQRAFSTHRLIHANNVLVETAVANTPAARSLSIWSGTFTNETRAWSPFVHHMSTAAAEKKEEETTTPSPVTENMKKEVGSENRTEISSYWGVAPKVHLKEDRTPWKWNCFTVRLDEVEGFQHPGVAHTM